MLDVYKIKFWWDCEDTMPSSEITLDTAIGIFNKYANPDLVPLEKEAWGMAVKEKHGFN
ncbi:MAG: regulator of G-protein signaling domain-containing protein [Defluviitaleaceae bacterium]|nr:regulator of G-protein signaling domain-containing protein [Defluviitaleaceae bacterium]